MKNRIVFNENHVLTNFYNSESDAVKQEFLGLLINSVYELKTGIVLAIQNDNKEAYSLVVHKAQSTINLIRNPEFDSLLKSFESYFTSRSKASGMKKVLVDFQLTCSALVDQLFKERNFLATNQ